MGSDPIVLRGYTNLGNFCYNNRLLNKGLIYPNECYAIRRAIYDVHDEMDSGLREAMGFVIPFVKIRGHASFACREAIRSPDERSEEPCEARSQEAER